MTSPSPPNARATQLAPEAHPDQAVTSDNDTHWLETHNAVTASAKTDPVIEVAGIERISPAVSEGEPRAKTATSESDAAEDEGSDASRSDHPHVDSTAEGSPHLPEDEVPPLPSEPLPEADDGWAPIWEESAQAFYFYNRFTGATQWTNPRVPDPNIQPSGPPGVAPAATTRQEGDDPASRPRPAGGYDPAVHGDYDPDAWYAQPLEPDVGVAGEGAPSGASTAADSAALYGATGQFNRFTGRWQAAELAPENFNDENKSKRQMNAFFDVDAAANSHDGKSLKAERSGKKLSKSELKQFKEKRKAKKEEKRRAWLRD
ncbi:MAG: hypothetical protein M1818_002298 [Claussenomyces sp. TS43310]|nr:MAG: hypothetical protein M1818_002298 [Claussenomyces sp. TS43310]